MIIVVALTSEKVLKRIAALVSAAFGQLHQPLQFISGRMIESILQFDVGMGTTIVWLNAFIVPNWFSTKSALEQYFFFKVQIAKGAGMSMIFDDVFYTSVHLLFASKLHCECARTA